LTGSGSDFRKRPDPDPVPDPDPDPNKFSANLFLKFFLLNYALKSIFMNQKDKQQRFLKYLWLLKIQKKVEIWSFIRARIRIRSQTSGSGSDQKGQDPQHCSKLL
jgi:hypothetical protein